MKVVRRLTKRKSRVSLKKKAGYIDFGIFLVYNLIMISQINVTFDRQPAMPMIIKKGAAPPIQDATESDGKIRVGEKVCFFCTLLQGINIKDMR